MQKKFIFLILSLIIIIGFTTACSHQENTNQSVEIKPAKTSKDTNHNKQDQVKIKIRINNQILNATLNNSTAAKAFSNELPKKLRFRTFMAGYPEKIADLHHALPTKGMAKGESGRKGTIGYWGPDQRIVFYYGTERYYEGIHIIGKFTSDNYVNVIKNMKNNTIVEITKNN